MWEVVGAWVRVCVTVWRYFPVRPKAQRVLALDASLAQPAVSAQRSIGGKRMLTGDDLTPGMTFHARIDRSWRDGLSAGFASVGTYSNQTCARAPAFHAWKR